MALTTPTYQEPIELQASRFGEPAAAVPKVRIVIAEGHKVLREGLRNLLSAENGFEVIGEAADADSTIVLVHRVQPDVLLVSATLGGESDAELLRRLELAGCRCRIIIMTQSTLREDHARAIRMGASGIMTHDTSPVMLAQGIRRVFAGELWVDLLAAADAMRQMIATRAAAPNPRPGNRSATSLSKREREVTALVSQGFRNKDIADRLFISEQTVKNHMHNIFEKLGVSDRLELALLAIHHGLL